MSKDKKTAPEETGEPVLSPKVTKRIEALEGKMKRRQGWLASYEARAKVLPGRYKDRIEFLKEEILEYQKEITALKKA